QRVQHVLQRRALAQALQENLALPLPLLQHVLHQVPARGLVHARPGADLLACAQATFAQAVVATAAKSDARAGGGRQGWNAHVEPEDRCPARGPETTAPACSRRSSKARQGMSRDYLMATSLISNTTATFGGKPVRGSAP